MGDAEFSSADEALNKGEALQSLRSQLFYANQGELKTQQDDQLLLR
ncbi:MAG: hypothetical protein RLZZ69_3589 [Cyanobacteriota bacterium]|jgi:TnpA family transposase